MITEDITLEEIKLRDGGSFDIDVRVTYHDDGEDIEIREFDVNRLTYWADGDTDFDMPPALLTEADLGKVGDAIHFSLIER
jgi:hypothetical protein